MAGVRTRCSPGQLGALFSQLAVRVDSGEVQSRGVRLADYPGRERPSSHVRLTGAHQEGWGENVAFTRAAHDRFAANVAAWLDARRHDPDLTVGDALGNFSADAYERAALQAALIDLGMRQAGRSLFDLTGVETAPLRFVISLAVSADPARAMRRLRDAGYGGDFKLDVDPDWEPATLARLLADASVVIFDFKGRGHAELARQVHAASSGALLEDPPDDFEPASDLDHRARVSRDAGLVDVSAVAKARARGEAVNLKAPRMGGPLELLRGLDHALSQSAPAYFGGMFEVGVGRTQARQLAALYCGFAPNDLAKNEPEDRPTAEKLASSPASVRLDIPGFGRE